MGAADKLKYRWAVHHTDQDIACNSWQREPVGNASAIISAEYKKTKNHGRIRKEITRGRNIDLFDKIHHNGDDNQDDNIIQYLLLPVSVKLNILSLQLLLTRNTDAFFMFLCNGNCIT